MTHPPLPRLAPTRCCSISVAWSSISTSARRIACWAGHAGCDPCASSRRFVRDEAYRRHEIGQISDADYFDSLRAALGIGLSDAQFLEGWNAIFAGEMPGIAALLARAAKRLPLYAFSNTNRPHVEHFSKAYADLLGHFRELYLSSSNRASETGCRSL